MCADKGLIVHTKFLERNKQLTSLVVMEIPFGALVVLKLFEILFPHMSFMTDCARSVLFYA